MCCHTKIRRWLLQGKFVQIIVDVFYVAINFKMSREHETITTEHINKRTYNTIVLKFVIYLTGHILYSVDLCIYIIQNASNNDQTQRNTQAYSLWSPFNDISSFHCWPNSKCAFISFLSFSSVVAVAEGKSSRPPTKRSTLQIPAPTTNWKLLWIATCNG